MTRSALKHYRFWLTPFAGAWLALAGSGFAALSPAAAAPWCHFGPQGYQSCGYFTLEQCRASASGVGGSCHPNAAEPAPARRPVYQQPARRAVPEERTRARQERTRERREAARPPARQRPAPARAPAPEPDEPAQSATPIVPTRPPAATPTPAPSQPAIATPTPVPTQPPAASSGPALTPTAAAAAVAPSALRKAAPPDARVYFIGLRSGQRVSSELLVRFGITNMGVAPAGIDKANTGHHHILVDTPLPPLNEPIPNDFNHLHFGAGQTEATITLPPGRHTLQLLLGDDNHVPHNPPVKSEVIEVLVTP